MYIILVLITAYVLWPLSHNQRPPPHNTYTTQNTHSSTQDTRHKTHHTQQTQHTHNTQHTTQHTTHTHTLASILALPWRGEGGHPDGAHNKV